MGDDRVHVVGIGVEGWAVVRAMREEEPDYVSLHGYCSRRGVLRVEDAWESASSIADADIARAVARRTSEQIVDELSNATLVVLVGSLAEPMAMGAAPIMAHALRDAGVCVVAVVAQDDAATGRLAARCLAEHGSVIAVDSELARSMYVDPATEDAETTADVVRALLTAASLTIAEQGPLGVDLESLATIVATKRRIGCFAAAAGAGTDRARRTTHAAFEALPARAKDFASAFVVRLASDERFRLEELRIALEVLVALAPHATHIAVGVAIHSCGEYLEVGIVALE